MCLEQKSLNRRKPGSSLMVMVLGVAVRAEMNIPPCCHLETLGSWLPSPCHPRLQVTNEHMIHDSHLCLSPPWMFFFYDKLVDYLLLNSLNAWIPAMFLLLKKTFKNTLFWEFRRKRFKVFLKVSTQFKACTSSEFLFPGSWTGQE